MQRFYSFRVNASSNTVAHPPRVFAHSYDAADFARNIGQYAGPMTADAVRKYLMASGGLYYAIVPGTPMLDLTPRRKRPPVAVSGATVNGIRLLTDTGAPPTVIRAKDKDAACSAAWAYSLVPVELDEFDAAAAHAAAGHGLLMGAAGARA